MVQLSPNLAGCRDRACHSHKKEEHPGPSCFGGFLLPRYCRVLKGFWAFLIVVLSQGLRVGGMGKEEVVYMGVITCAVCILRVVCVQWLQCTQACVKGKRAKQGWEPECLWGMCVFV